MEIVVSGGTGLIGRMLVQDLAGDGHDVVVLSSHPSQISTIIFPMLDDIIDSFIYS